MIVKSRKPQNKLKKRMKHSKIQTIRSQNKASLSRKKLSRKTLSELLTFLNFLFWIFKNLEKKSVQDHWTRWNTLSFIRLFMKKMFTLWKNVTTQKDAKTFKSKSLLRISPVFIQEKLYMIMSFMNQHLKIRNLFFTEFFGNKSKNMELFSNQKMHQMRIKTQIWLKI